MSLFDNINVEEFKAIPAVRDKFRNYELLNSLAFKIFLNEDPDDDVDLEMGSKKMSQSAKKRLYALEDNPEKVAGDMVQLKIHMCNTVNGYYVKSSIARALGSDYPGYDAIIIIKPALRSTSRTPPEETEAERIARLRKDKMAKIVGFLIAQRGECPKYPNAYSVNLICAREKGISSMLMGCYMYCIKRHSRYMQKGLLELAGAYDNLNGFCAYRKMGYVFDPDIYSANCLKFEDEGDALLPMSVDIASMSIDDIIARTTQSTPIDDVLCDRRFSTNLGEQENRQENMFRLSIKIIHRLYYLVSMFFTRKDKVASFFLFNNTQKPYMRLLKNLLQQNYAPMTGAVAYAKLKLCFLQIIKWIESGGSFNVPPPEPIKHALTKLYGLYPPGILSVNPLLNHIEMEIHSMFDSYMAYQASVRDGTYVSPPHSSVAAVAPVARSTASKAKMLLEKTVAKLKAKRTPNSPARSVAEIKRDAIKLLIEKLRSPGSPGAKNAKASGSPTSPSSASRKKKGKGKLSTTRSSAKFGKKKSQSKTAKKLASASSKQKLQKTKADPSDAKADPSDAKADPSDAKADPSDAKSDPSDEDIGMYYTLGSNMMGELGQLPNIAKVNKVMGELGIKSKMVFTKFMQETQSQCTTRLYEGNLQILQRFVTIYIMNNRTNQILSSCTIGPNTTNGLDFHNWVIISRICSDGPMDEGERAVIQSICESLNTEFA